VPKRKSRSFISLLVFDNLRFAYSPAAAAGSLLTKAQKSLNQTVAAGASVVNNCGGAVATATDTTAATATDTAAASATDAATATITDSTAATATDTAAASVTDVAETAVVRFLEFVQYLPKADLCGDQVTACPAPVVCPLPAFRLGQSF
jgi:hypothetical protein